MYNNNSKAGWMSHQKLLELDSTLLPWVTGITLLLLAAFILLGNSFVVAIIALDPLKNIRRSPSNHLVLSLAVADFMIGATICFFSGWWYFHFAVYREDLFNLAQTNVGLGQFELVDISTTSLLALGIDRLIAIKVPLRYSYTVTKQRVRIVVVFTWLYFVGLAAIFWNFSLKGTIKQDFIFNCHNVVAFLGLVINCGIVIHALRKQSNAMKHLGECSTALRNIVEREKKVTKETIMITLVFIACFVPFFISQLLEYFCAICWTNFPEVLIVYRNVALLIVLINSMANPYIYAYRLPKYLEAFKHLGKKLLCCKSNANVAPTENANRVRVKDLTDTATHEKNTMEETKL